MKLNHPATLSILVAVLATTCHGQKFTFGSCPTVNSVTLTFANLINTWREYARTPLITEHGWKCVTYTFTLVTANVQYNLVIDGYKKTGAAVRLTGLVDIGGTAAAAATAVSTSFLGITIYKGINKSLRYYVLASDDATYIVLYACTNVLFGKLESVIILTLSTVTDANVAKALNSLSLAGISRHSVKRTEQNNCGSF